MRRLAIAGTVLLAVVSAADADGRQETWRAGARTPVATNVAAPDEALRARIIDIQQTLDRILADTTPAPVGTTGVSAKAKGIDTQSAGPTTVTVERARLLQLRRQLDALIDALNKP